MSGSFAAHLPSAKALEVLRDEGLIENSRARGEQLRQGLQALAQKPKSPIALVRGRGLLNAIVIGSHLEKFTIYYIYRMSIEATRAATEMKDVPGSCVARPDLDIKICFQGERMAKNGLLAKPTHGTIIRLAPPLCITAAEIDECVDIIGQGLEGM